MCSKRAQNVLKAGRLSSHDLDSREIRKNRTLILEVVVRDLLILKRLPVDWTKTMSRNLLGLNKRGMTTKNSMQQK